MEPWILGFALGFPSALTWLYFVVLADAASWVQQVAYSAGKLVQFSLPVVFLTLVAGERIRFPFSWRARLREAFLSGLTLLMAIVLLWQLLSIFGSSVLDELVPNISAKIAGFGVATPLRYVGLALFYSVVHTFLEEYYWRWFVFSRLQRRTGWWTALWMSSFGFMAHHVIVMGVYAGWRSPYTYLFSGCVALGGAYWAWLYQRSGSLTAPWISHCFVDVAIFAVGYTLI